MLPIRAIPRPTVRAGALSSAPRARSLTLSRVSISRASSSSISVASYPVVNNVGGRSLATTPDEFAESRNAADSVTVFNNELKNFTKASDLMKHWLRGIESGITPNIASYTLAISLLGRKGASNLAVKLFEELKSKGWTPDHRTYFAILNSLQGPKYDPNVYLKQLEEQGLSMNENLHSSYLNALARTGRYDEMMKQAETMKERGATFTTANFAEMINSAVEHRKLDHGLQLLQEWRNTNQKPTRAIERAALSLLARAKNVEELQKAAEEFRAAGITPDRITYSNLIVGTRNVELYQEMKSKGWFPDQYAYETILSVHAKDGKAAWAVYEDAKANGVRLTRTGFRILLLALFRSKMYQEYGAVVQHFMKEYTKPPSSGWLGDNSFSYIAAISALGSLKQFNLAKLMFEEWEAKNKAGDFAKSQGDNMSDFVAPYNLMIRNSALIQNWSGVLHYFNGIKAAGLQPDQRTYQDLSRAVAEQGDPQRVLELFEESKKFAPPTATEYNCVIRAFAVAKDLDGLLKHFNEMKANPSSPPNGYTYHQLISLLSSKGDKQGMLQYFNEMQAQGIAPLRATGPLMGDLLTPEQQHQLRFSRAPKQESSETSSSS